MSSGRDGEGYMSDARARFVKAMRALYKQHTTVPCCPPDVCPVHEAIEAFADAECADQFKMESLKLAGSWEATKHDHAACRASLLRECGLTEESHD